jgi:exopolyphosphatase/guanosine-5'-triphosphate,3'-diphosphate pyrophosphatase
VRTEFGRSTQVHPGASADTVVNATSTFQDGGGLALEMRGQVFCVGQSLYYAAVVVLGAANVLLAAVAYAQRARQLEGRQLLESQIALAEQRNRMAEARVERLDRQVALLTAIRDSVASDRNAAFSGSRPRRREVVGVIDVGSTTVRMVVVHSDPVTGKRRAIGDERAFLHLGAEVSREGLYGRETLRNVAARVAAFQHRANVLGCSRVEIVVTAPGRQGKNPDELVAAIQRSTRRHVVSLSAEEEAQLTFIGAVSSARNGDQRFAVCDVGGGSTDIAFGTRSGGVEQTACFDLGAVTLAERHFSASPQRTRKELAQARKYAGEHLLLADPPACDLVLATGGSASALSKLVGPVVDAEAFDEALEMTTELPRRFKRRVHTQRRWSLPAGIVLLGVVQSQLGIPLTVSRAGLREGVI